MSASYLPQTIGMPQVNAPSDEQLAQWRAMQQQNQQTTTQGLHDEAPGPSEPTAPPAPAPPPVMPPVNDPSSPLEPPTPPPAPTPTGIAGTLANPFQQASLQPFRTSGMISDRTLFGANTAGVPMAGSGLGLSSDAGGNADRSNPDDEMRRQAAKEALISQFFAQ